MHLPIKIIFLFFSLQFFSQSNFDFQKVEKYIIANKLDSATYILNNLKNSPKKILLDKLIEKNQLTYRDVYQFIINLTKRQNIDYIKVAGYINKEVKAQ